MCLGVRLIVMRKRPVDIKCSPLQQRPPSSPPPLQCKDLGQHEAGTHYHGPIVNFFEYRYVILLDVKVESQSTLVERGCAGGSMVGAPVALNKQLFLHMCVLFS